MVFAATGYLRLAYRGYIDARVIDENTPPQTGMAGERDAYTSSKLRKTVNRRLYRYIRSLVRKLFLVYSNYMRRYISMLDKIFQSYLVSEIHLLLQFLSPLRVLRSNSSLLAREVCLRGTQGTLVRPRG